MFFIILRESFTRLHDVIINVLSPFHEIFVMLDLYFLFSAAVLAATAPAQAAAPAPAQAAAPAQAPAQAAGAAQADFAAAQAPPAQAPPAQAAFAGAAPHPSPPRQLLRRDAQARAPIPNVPVVHDLVILDSPTRPALTVVDQAAAQAQAALAPAQAAAPAPAQAAFAGAAPHPSPLSQLLRRDAQARAPTPNDSPARPAPRDLVTPADQTPDANAPDPTMAPANIGLPQEQDMDNGPRQNMPINPMPGSPNLALPGSPNLAIPDLPVATEPRNLRPRNVQLENHALLGAPVRPTAASRIRRRSQQ